MCVHAFEISHMHVLQIDTCLSHLKLDACVCVIDRHAFVSLGFIQTIASDAIIWEKYLPFKLAHTLFGCFPDNVFEKLVLSKKTIACMYYSNVLPVTGMHV